MTTVAIEAWLSIRVWRLILCSCLHPETCTLYQGTHSQAQLGVLWGYNFLTSNCFNLKSLPQFSLETLTAKKFISLFLTHLLILALLDFELKCYLYQNSGVTDHFNRKLFLDWCSKDIRKPYIYWSLRINYKLISYTAKGLLLHIFLHVPTLCFYQFLLSNL